MSGYKTRLERESAGWVGSGIITAEQRAALLAQSTGEPGPGRFVAAMAGVGACLVLTGIFLLISANWREIGDWVKIGGLVVLLTGAYVAGWRLKISPGLYPKTGDAFFTLGAGLFLAGIALVSQIFHLDSRPSAGVLVWWLGIAAIPWLVRSKGTQVLSVIAGLLWFVLEVTHPGSWLTMGEGSHMNHRFWALVALLAPLGCALWLVGLRLRDTAFDDFSGLHEKFGALLVCTALYALGFVRHDWSWHDLPARVASIPVAFVLLAGSLAGWAAWRTGRGDARRLTLWLGLTLIPVIPILIAWNVGDGGWLWSALAWIVLFVLNLAMINLGHASGRAGWVNLGLLFIALNIVTRYFDLFGTMLEGGIFFVVTGIVVISLGTWLERKRRLLLGTMRAGREAA